MEERDFYRLLNQAQKAVNNLKSKEDNLSIFFQPYFDEEIFVLYQESDGFVILHNTDIDIPIYSNLNTGVNEAFENIMKNPNFYRKN